MIKKITKIILSVLLVTIISTCNKSIMYAEEATTEENTTEENTTEETNPVRILLVGNSFTYSGGTGIKEMLENIAKSQGENIEADAIVNPGAYLSHYTNTNIKKFAFYYRFVSAISTNKYDYVVLQENSYGSVENVQGMCESIEKLKSYIEYFQKDTKVLLYMTHPYEEDVAVKINDSKTYLPIKDRLDYTHAGYVYAGKEAEVKVVDAGIGFFRAYTAFPKIGWYQEDNKHPTRAAFFAMACSFYKEIYGKIPVFDEKNSVEKAKLTLEEQQNIASVAYNSLEFKKDCKTMRIGEQFEIEYNFNDENIENVNFRSLNRSIASVKNGVITANSEGITAIIGKTKSGSQAVCIVIVENDELRKKGILFVNNKHTLEIGETFKSIPKVRKAYKKHKMKWSTSNKKIAKVNSDGVVTAIAPGRAKITVKDVVNGKSASYYVYIRNKAPVDIAVSCNTSNKSVYNKITWKKSKNATDYVIYRSTKADSGYVKIATTKRKVYIDKSIEKNKIYYYRVTAYKKFKMCESDKSDYVKGISLSTPKLDVVSKRKKKVKIKWNKNNYATGYIIYRSNGKNKPYKKIGTITSKKKISYIDKKVRAKRTYYYVIQAYRKIGDKVFYSAHSNAIKVKVPNK